MSVNLKVNLGTVNYTDFLHVTASKVSSPGAIAWQDWIDVPVTNYNFVIPGLDPENYYVRYYDAPDDTSLGSLVAELIVNALTSDILYERRWYTCNGSGPGDPVAGVNQITDPYLIDKNVVGIFKEGFRFLKEVDEYDFDNTTGVIDIIGANVAAFADAERMSVDIKYNTGSSTGTTAGALYNGTLVVTEVTKTLLVADANKRIKCKGTSSTQVITLCPLVVMGGDQGFYFDNSEGGTAQQIKLLFYGADQLRFNGFMIGTELFTEFWISKGEHALIRKYIDVDLGQDFWEVITDYKGVCVGEKVTVGFKSHPNVLPENGQLIDGDEYPRLWWWVKNILPATHKYTTDTVTGAFTPTLNRLGQFAVHSTLKKFRMPKTTGMTEKGLADFETYGADTANRAIDYPGGFQDHMLSDHQHISYTQLGNNASGTVADDAGGNTFTINRLTSGVTNAAALVGNEMRTRNTGVIFGRRI